MVEKLEESQRSHKKELENLKSTFKNSKTIDTVEAKEGSGQRRTIQDLINSKSRPQSEKTNLILSLSRKGKKQ